MSPSTHREFREDAADPRRKFDPVSSVALSLRDWVPAGSFGVDRVGAVEEMDLSGFYRAYRDDGHGRPAYDPAMMVALLLYSYARGNRSSRAIERACAGGRRVSGDLRELGAGSLDDR